MKLINIGSFWNFKGYVVEEVRKEEGGDVHVSLRPDERCTVKCPQCGSKMGENRVTESTARDLPFLDKQTWIHYPSIQGRCASCKAYHTVRPDEIDERRQATTRLMFMVHTLCIHMPLSAAASFCSISSATAYRWDRAVLEQLLPEPQLDGLRVPLIDEKSVRKKTQLRDPSDEWRYWRTPLHGRRQEEGKLGSVL